jgi:hypothetical protein
MSTVTQTDYLIAELADAKTDYANLKTRLQVAESALAAAKAERDEAQQKLHALRAREQRLKAEVEELRVYKEISDAQDVMRPKPKNPTLWMYLDDSHKNGVIDFHIRIEREPGGGSGFKFYIHAAQASSSTEDFYIWAEPHNWHDLIANTKDLPTDAEMQAGWERLRKQLFPARAALNEGEG